VSGVTARRGTEAYNLPREQDDDLQRRFAFNNSLLANEHKGRNNPVKRSGDGHCRAFLGLELRRSRLARLQNRPKDVKERISPSDFGRATEFTRILK
jgi:hypothetical protein